MPSFDYPQFWDNLTKKQALEVFDAYVDEHPIRVAAAIRYFDSLGFVAGTLDFTGQSLEQLWPAVLNNVNIPTRRSDDWNQADMPPWAAFRHEESRRVGPAVVDTVSFVAAYFSECVLRADAQTRFRLGDQKNASGYRKPLLMFPSGVDLSTEELVQKILLRAIEGQGPNAASDAAPDGLRRHMDLRLKSSASTVPARDEDLFEIHPAGDSSYHVTFTAEVDERTSEALTRLVAEARDTPAITTIVRQDDDILLVSTPLQRAELLRHLEATFRRVSS